MNKRVGIMIIVSILLLLVGCTSARYQVDGYKRYQITAYDGWLIATPDSNFADKARELPIPLISPPDSEGKRHAIPKDVATLFRIMSPPL